MMARISATLGVLALLTGPGCAARGDSSWRSRAIRSFPVPLSPVMSTVASTLATRRASAMSCRILGPRATRPAGSSASSSPLGSRSSTSMCVTIGLMS